MDRLISEKAVLEAFREYQGSISDFYKAIKAIPSAEPCEDAISRQAVLDEINRIGVKGFETYNDYSQLYDFVDTLSPVKPQEPKWTLVSERLPTKEEFIANNGLFIVSDGNRTYAEYFDVYCSMRFGEPTMSGFRVDRCVAAWMPLPPCFEPQKGANE